ncbi:MAG: J domain-containing protein [Deltaproteobacteria bacterium]|nr:J domain-containing protein [Deltaproteobacteria bacterium]
MNELNEPFLQARRTLGVGLDDPASAIRRAYRRAVAEHPPDRDPEAFQRLRAAFELLTDPLEATAQRLDSKGPMVPPPVLPPPPAPGDVLVAMLRYVATQLDSDELLDSKGAGEHE